MEIKLTDCLYFILKFKNNSSKEEQNKMMITHSVNILISWNFGGKPWSVLAENKGEICSKENAWFAKEREEEKEDSNNIIFQQ